MSWMGGQGVNRGDHGGEQVHGQAMGDSRRTAQSGVNALQKGKNQSMGGNGTGGQGGNANGTGNRTPPKPTTGIE